MQGGYDTIIVNPAKMRCENEYMKPGGSRSATAASSSWINDRKITCGDGEDDRLFDCGFPALFLIPILVQRGSRPQFGSAGRLYPHIDKHCHSFDFSSHVCP
jgi:hypothetical protein